MILFVTLSALAFGAIGAAIALRTGTASVVQGLFPLVFVDPLPLLRLLPRGPDHRARRRRSPSTTRSSFIVEGVRDPVISVLTGRGLLEGGRRDRADPRDRHRLQRAGAPSPAEDGRLMEAGSLRARRPRLARRSGGRRRADPPLGQRAAPRPRRGDPGRAGADDLLPRAHRGVRQPDAAAGLRHRQLPELHHPGEPDAGRRLHRRRDRRQPGPRHRAGVVRPPARLPRPAPGPARRPGALGERARARARDRAALRRLRDRRRLARDRRAPGRARPDHGDGHRRGAAGARRSRSSSSRSRRRP